MLILSNVFNFQSSSHQSGSHHLCFLVIFANSLSGHKLALSPVQRLFCPIFPSLPPFLQLFFIYFQREGEGEREGEKHQCERETSHLRPGDLAQNSGIWPDWESNQQPNFQFTGWCSVPHQPGLFFLKKNWFKGERDRNRNIDLLFHLLMHSLVAPCLQCTIPELLAPYFNVLLQSC